MQSLVEWTPLSYSRDLEVKPKKIVGNIVCLILLFILVFWGKKDKDVLVNLSPTHWWGTAVVVKRIHKFQWSLIVWHLFLLLRRKSIQFLFLHFFLLRYPLSLADEELQQKRAWRIEHVWFVQMYWISFEFWITWFELAGNRTGNSA